MAFHFRLQGTRAQVIAAANALAPSGLSALDLQLHTATVNAIDDLLNVHNSVPKTYASEGLVVEVHGHADEKSTRLEFSMQQHQLTGAGQVSTALPAKTNNGELASP